MLIVYNPMGGKLWLASHIGMPDVFYKITGLFVNSDKILSSKK